MTTDADLSSLLAGLYPSDVATIASRGCPPGATLMGAEASAAAAMAPKRQNEFRHGRHCARQALAELGFAAAAIPKLEDRSPLWPDGVIGSISHTANVAAAVAGNASDYSGLGLDIESAEGLDEATCKMILRPDELALHDAHTAKLIFSIKETIYKCIFPLVGTYVDFQEMAVDLDTQQGRFRAQPYSDKVPADVATRLEGRFTRTGEFVVSSAWLART